MDKDVFVTIKKIKEKPDGGADIEFEYDERLVNLIKKTKKIKRVTQKTIQNFLLEGLKNFCYAESSK